MFDAIVFPRSLPYFHKFHSEKNFVQTFSRRKNQMKYILLTGFHRFLFHRSLVSFRHSKNILNKGKCFISDLVMTTFLFTFWFNLYIIVYTFLHPFFDMFFFPNSFFHRRFQWHWWRFFCDQCNNIERLFLIVAFHFAATNLRNINVIFLFSIRILSPKTIKI